MTASKAQLSRIALGASPAGSGLACADHGVQVGPGAGDTGPYGTYGAAADLRCLGVTAAENLGQDECGAPAGVECG